MTTRDGGHSGLNIVALDGGGIYGLTEVLLLKKLCRANEGFLTGDDAPIFAGCSAGALNALLLAREREPREALLSGKIEAFWWEAGTFSNSDPIRSLLSFQGLTPWYSDTDFLCLLDEYFGDVMLPDLAHRAIVTAYNWTGRRPDFSDVPERLPWPFTVFAAVARARADRRPATSWGPVCFHNIAVPEDMQQRLGLDESRYPGAGYRVADIAYAAAAPPGLRPIRGGVGDGGSFNANPTLTALGMAQLLRLEDPSEPCKIRDLDDIALLSVGAGQIQPAYWLRDIDLGFTAFSLAPTNPLMGVWLSPAAYALDPAVEDAEIVARHILGCHFHRLNPPVMWSPTLMAVAAPRFPWVLEQFIDQIYTAIDAPRVDGPVAEAAAFIARQWNHRRARAA
jgi:hypothetical protein